MPPRRRYNAALVSADALPRLCGDCGYRLDGLPRDGQCPECGGDYAADELVLFGWAGQTKATFANSPSARAAGFVVLGALGLVSAAVLVAEQIRRAPAVIWAAAGTATAFVWYHCHKLRSAGTPPVQLRITARGVAQHDGVGPPDRWEPWPGRWRMRLAPLGPSRYRLVMERVPTQWLEVPGRAVDFEFDAAPTTVTALRHVIESFSSAAGGELEVVMA